MIQTQGAEPRLLLAQDRMTIFDDNIARVMQERFHAGWKTFREYRHEEKLTILWLKDTQENLEPPKVIPVGPGMPVKLFPKN